MFGGIGGPGREGKIQENNMRLEKRRLEHQERMACIEAMKEASRTHEKIGNLAGGACGVK